MAKWYSLDSVPRDGSRVLFWVPDFCPGPIEDGAIYAGRYDSALDAYFSDGGDDLLPVCWTHAPRGPESAAEICFERGEP